MGAADRQHVRATEEEQLRSVSRVALITLVSALSWLGCATTSVRSRPPFPIFSGATSGISAVTAEVDSLVEGNSPLLLVSARVLTVIHGKERNRIAFPTSIGLSGCWGAWDAVGFGGGDYDPGAESTHWWFALGDTIVAVVRDEPNGRAWQQASFVRWLRSSPGCEGQVAMKEGKADLAGVFELCRRAPDASAEERYAAVGRNWTPDGRTTSQLTEEIADFYGNRRREYWMRWHYRDPWAPHRPVRWPEGPPPMPGE